MPCVKKDGLEIKRSTLCQSSHFADMELYCPSPLTAGKRSFLHLKLTWGESGQSGSILRFKTLPNGGTVVFDQAGGLSEKPFTGNVDANLAIFAVTQSAAANDVRLEIVVRDTVRAFLDLTVAVPSNRTERAVLDSLRDELVSAVAFNRPPANPQRQIWDHYNAIYQDGVAISAQLTTAIENISVPLANGQLAALAFPTADVRAALTEGRNPSGSHAKSARYHRLAFEFFEGRWRGHWRQDFGCGIRFPVCQDHEWRATQGLANAANILYQEVVLGDDSSYYVGDVTGNCVEGPGGQRDSDQYAINLIDTQTGLILGAVGQRDTPLNGVLSQRPHIGYYLDYQTLVWLAQEGNNGDQVTYSIFHEQVAPDDQGHPEYTILAIDVVLNRTNGTLVNPITTKGGRYRKLLVEPELSQDRHFWLGQLDDALLQQERYRRRLELMSAVALRRLRDAAAPGPIKIYLGRVADFAAGLEALAAAPSGVRDSITFLMGSNDPFYNAANNYFTLNPSTRVIQFANPLQSNITCLDDIRRFLGANRPASGPWGQVNIVVHASPFGFIVANLYPGGTGITQLSDLETIDVTRFVPVPDNILDARSEIYLRGCEIGTVPAFLEQISKRFAGTGSDDWSRPAVYAPKLIQYFTSETTPSANRLDFAEQFLQQKWKMLQPMSRAYNQATTAAEFSASYAAAFPNINWSSALSRTVARYPGDFYRETKENIHYTYRLIVPNPGAIDLSTPALQRAFAAASPNLAAFLSGLHVSFNQFDWTAQANGNVITILGNCRIIYILRDIVADLAPVFTLLLARQPELTARTLTPALKNEFLAAGHPLGDDVEINILWVDNRWLVLDRQSGSSFLVVRGVANLQVSIETARPIVEVTAPGDAAQIANHLASVNRSTPTRLFQLPKGIFTDLDRGFIPGSAVNIFSQRGVALDANTTIKTQEEHQSWAIFNHGKNRAFALVRIGTDTDTATDVFMRPDRFHPAITYRPFIGSHQPINPNPQPAGQNVAYPPTP